MDQVLEDIRSAAADDPVFSILDPKGRGEDEEQRSSDTHLRQVPNLLIPSDVLRFRPQNRPGGPTARWSCASNSVCAI